jgi:hypothetical protein
MLNQKYPKFENWGKYLENTSSCRPFVSYTWPYAQRFPNADGKDQKRPLVQKPPILGPGEYKYVVVVTF